jgi:hypothetical protein
MLKYLFAAQFNDGTLYHQDQTDASPYVAGKSQFYDVLQREKDLVAFALNGDTHSYAVDLSDGHFEIDEIPFQVYDMPIKNRRLIFFRRHSHDFNVDSVETAHTIEYHIGWQGNTPDTGENIQRVIIIR